MAQATKYTRVPKYKKPLHRLRWHLLIFSVVLHLEIVTMGLPDLPVKLPHKALRSRLLLPYLLLIAVAFLYWRALGTHRIIDLITSGSQLSQVDWNLLDAGLNRCAVLRAPPTQYTFPVSADRENPRWSSLSGQSKPVLLRNATLFDGDSLQESVDILFERGVVRKITSTASAQHIEGATVQELNGLIVTPGLVDMHSHHLVGSWPSFRATDDINEIHPSTGPLTPFVRALDSIKAYDPATTVIASGGVTSSLILPGSANIMGGEAVIVKNFLKAGDHGEENVEELLLEHGIPKDRRRRYMKMACGENPRRVYGHTRMGNAWILREHLARAKELRDKQDTWCLSAAAAKESGDLAAISSLVGPGPDGHRGLPEELELDSTVGILRGQVGVNIHCYEPEDMEDMILHSEEFGFRIQAFHHSLSSWKVPELIKASGQYVESTLLFKKTRSYLTNITEI